VARVRVNSSWLYVDLRDNVGVGWPLYINRSYELAETAFFHRILKPGMVFVDIGANVGYFTVLASRLVGDAGTVIAVEPEPKNFELLKRNVNENKLRNVILLNTALGATTGQAELFLSASNYGDHQLYRREDESRQPVSVPLDTLDNALARCNISRVDVIKMDVQGYEYQILAGMRRTLAYNAHLVVLTEFWPQGLSRAGGSDSQLWQDLMEFNFSASLLQENGKEQPLQWHEISEHLARRPGARRGVAYLNIAFSK
jgi:FkbM family methyltransferase